MFVNLWVTTSCNFSCKYCYEGEKKKSFDLSKPTLNNLITHIIQEIKDVDEEIIIEFHGGEPLLNFPLIEYTVNKINCIFPKNKKRYGITTNAYYLDEKKADFLAEIIYEKCNLEDQFYIVKILGKNNRGNSEVLYEALKCLLYIDIKYIVVCVATENTQTAYKCQEIVNQLVKQGKVIFSSWINGAKCINSYPAMLDNVISVRRGILELQKLNCDFNRKVQCIVDIDPAFIWIHNKGFQAFGGNSQATAEFVAFMSKRIGDVKDTKEFMQKAMVHNETNVKLSKKCNCNKKINECIVELVQKYVGHISIDIPLWRIFPSLSEFLLFLEDVCNMLKIDKKKVILRKSMLLSLLIFSESLEQIKSRII